MKMTEDLVNKHYKLEKRSNDEGTEMSEKIELRIFHMLRKQVDDKNMEYLWPELLRF
jgi:hypothetical protein